MKISYNWLKEYLPIDLPAEKVGEILTDIGLELEGIEQVQSIKGGLEGLIVGEVLTAEQHPNADRLKVTTVNVGNGSPLHIVCGAPNVAAGQKVVVAQVGTVLHPTEGEPFKIKKGKIRGEVSMGMICAEDEIGIGTEHDGIIVLPTETPVGKTAKEVFKVEEDEVFEIGLTPNRSDATSHVGVAKDLAAYLEVHHNFKDALQLPDLKEFTIDNNDLEIPVEVEDTEACTRYTGVSITGVTVKESPEWLQNKLNAIGVRPISNIVDITNYILHELGQPLHAFDADKINGKKVLVKTLAQGASFITLDEMERKLDARDLMICNANSEGMCIAGVFGGIESGVTDSTTNIFLESARFHPIRTRQTATRHNLRTDAAIRFEKGVDPNLQVDALKRAALLIKELAGGKIASDIVDIYPKKVERPQVRLTFQNLNRLIGIEIPKPTVHHILTALDIQILEETEESLLLSVGTNRADVLREADIIEEVLRIYGFNNIPMPKTLNTSLSYSRELEPQVVENTVADFLAANGFNEMMATSLSNSEYYDSEDSSLVYLQNSLNVELNVMRKNMLFSGLQAIAYNQNRQNADVKLFEFGKTYFTYSNDAGKHYGENNHLALYLTGHSAGETWQGAQQAITFFDLKKAVHKVLYRLGIRKFRSDFCEKNEPFSYGLRYKVGKKELVSFGAVSKGILKQMDVKQTVFYADFNWDVILEVLRQQKLSFEGFSKYPSIRRDLALLLDKKLTFGEIAQIAVKTGKYLLKSVNLFDIYENEEKIGADKKSYAVSFIFEDARKTLTDKEVDKMMKKLISSFERQLGASIR